MCGGTDSGQCPWAAASRKRCTAATCWQRRCSPRSAAMSSRAMVPRWPEAMASRRRKKASMLLQAGAQASWLDGEAAGSATACTKRLRTPLLSPVVLSHTPQRSGLHTEWGGSCKGILQRKGRSQASLVCPEAEACLRQALVESQQLLCLRQGGGRGLLRQHMLACTAWYGRAGQGRLWQQL